MPDFFSDPCLALSARRLDDVVGWRADGPVTQAMLRERLGAWRALALRTPGSQIALYLEDSVEFAAALLGAWQAGKTVWLAADVLAASCKALASSVDVFWGEFPLEWAPQSPAATDHCDLPLSALDPDFLALQVHTSGTTGIAQVIAKKLYQLSNELEALESTFGAELGRASIAATVSHQHIYGLLFRVLWPLAAGRAIYALRLTFPEELARLLGRRECVLIASPAHLKRLPAHLDWSACAGKLRAVFSSGGPLDQAAAIAAGTMLGKTPIEVYGSSETGGIAWRQHVSGNTEAWTALPKVEWRIAGQGKLLEVRSPHLADDRWLRLADRVEAADSGRFVLAGRSDRIVKIEEKRISLDSIENALSVSELVAHARVIVDGRTESSRTESECPQSRQALAAIVALSPAGRTALAEGGKLGLNRRLRETLLGIVEQVAMPRRWRYVEELPFNAQGKTTQAMLQALLDATGDAEQIAVADARPRLPQIRVLEQDQARLLFEVTVPPDLFYFDGHFPGAPVLPGVVQVDWAIRYARQYFQLAPKFRAIHALKFQHVIQADHPVQLELIHDSEKNSLAFRYFSPAGQHASGRILFEL